MLSCCSSITSTPAFSTHAGPCRCFHSRIFHHCNIVPIFPLLHFPSLQNRADISTPAFSSSAFSRSFVPIFPHPFFPLPHFKRPLCVLVAVCSTRLTEFSGVIESPNFPYSYESGTNCEWVIETTVGNTINASFSQFDLQPQVRGSCSADYIEVRETTWSILRLLLRL